MRLSVLVLLLMAAPLAARAETAAPDPRAVAVADRVMESLGGRAAWDALRGLRWTFGVAVNDTVRSSRRHAWDKHTGWHRVEGLGRDGVPFLFITHVNTGEGRCWMGGQAIAGDSLKKLVARAKSLWINDTYWLLMPYKLRDPGVTLGLAEPVAEGGATFERLALSFADVGQTPGDRYWVWVDRADHRVKKWEMILQSDPPAGPPTVYTWEGWTRAGGLWFPTSHRNGPRDVFTSDVEAVDAFPAGTFERP
jgi:hypothetical protein